MPFVVLQLLYRRRSYAILFLISRKKAQLLQNFMFLFFCVIVRGNKLESAAFFGQVETRLCQHQHLIKTYIGTSSIGRNGSPSLRERNRSLQRNVCSRGIFQPRLLLIFFHRYLVGIHSFFYWYQSVSSRIRPDMSCHPHHGPGAQTRRRPWIPHALFQVMMGCKAWFRALALWCTSFSSFHCKIQTCDA